MFRLLHRSAAVAVNSSSGRFTSLSHVRTGAQNWLHLNTRYLSNNDRATNYFDILGVDVREVFNVQLVIICADMIYDLTNLLSNIANIRPVYR